MEYKPFGETGLTASVLALGSWSMGSNVFWGTTDDDACIAAIHTAMDEGVDMIDTAPSYSKGRSEQLVGRALKGRRDKMQIVAKTGVYQAVEGVPTRDASPGTINRLLEETLANLQTDYVDVLMLHWPDADHPLEDTMAALAAIKQSGKARLIGVSNFDRPLLEKARALCDISVLQLRYSMVDRANRELLEWAAGQGMAVMTYGSLGGGILSGAVRTPTAFAEKDARGNFYDAYREPKFSRVMALLKVMDEISARHGANNAQLALNWNRQQPFVHSAIFGARGPEKVRDNCAGMAWSLSDEEMARLNSCLDEQGL